MSVDLSVIIRTDFQKRDNSYIGGENKKVTKEFCI